MEQAEETLTLDQRFVEAIEQNNKLLQRLNHRIGDWKWLLMRGVLIGFGTVVGATLVVSIVVAILQPFQSLDGLGPAIERLTKELRQD